MELIGGGRIVKEVLVVYQIPERRGIDGVQIAEGGGSGGV